MLLRQKTLGKTHLESKKKTSWFNAKIRHYSKKRSSKQLTNRTLKQGVAGGSVHLHDYISHVPQVSKWIDTSSTPRRFIHQWPSISRSDMIKSFLSNQRSKVVRVKNFRYPKRYTMEFSQNSNSNQRAPGQRSKLWRRETKASGHLCYQRRDESSKACLGDSNLVHSSV